MRPATDDDVRQGEINTYRVLGEPPQRDLQALVGLAADVFGVPSAAINLITDGHQHQIATAGFAPSICARSDSMCAAVLSEPQVLLVPDARLDERFAANPFVTGVIGDVRFYASAPLVTPQQVTIGRLCVFDTVPRTASEAQRAALRTLAERVVDVLELRLRTRQLEQSVADLTAARNELHRSNENLTRFAAQVSHDLRTPLTAILANAEVLSTEPAVAEDPSLRPLLDALVDAGGRMSLLIHEILAYAQVGAQLRIGDADLGKVVRRALADLGPAVRPTGARVEVAELPTVAGDEYQLYAVVLNLLSNALKFARPGVPPEIQVTAEQRGDRWRIAVTDHGIGIPPELRDDVFTLFSRGQHDREGSGIGLATARQIVEAHGGAIGLDLGVPGATTVWFEV